MEILVVDKDAGFLDLLKRRMLSWGNKVVSVDKSANALQVFLNGHYDLILIDAWLKTAGGRELIPAFKAKDASAKIVAMVEENSREMEAMVRSYGIIFYWIKSNDLSDLKSIIDHTARKCSEGQRFIYHGFGKNDYNIL